MAGVGFLVSESRVVFFNRWIPLVAVRPGRRDACFGMNAPSTPTWRKPIEAFASSVAGAAFLRRFGHLIDRPLLRLTRGRFAMTFGLPTLLLTTTGRKSGEPRSVPLVYVEHGDDLAVVGTRFGSGSHPAWYLNLVASPEAWVTLHGEEFAVTAREATPVEYEVLWRQATKIYSGFEKYKRRVGPRKIPIVILSRFVE